MTRARGGTVDHLRLMRRMQCGQPQDSGATAAALHVMRIERKLGVPLTWSEWTRVLDFLSSQGFDYLKHKLTVSRLPNARLVKCKPYDAAPGVVLRFEWGNERQ